MFYCRSLVTQQLLHATEVDARECVELQAVCPACSSPVYKSGSEYTKLQYLAHYAGAHPDCELRVRRIVQRELGRSPVVTTPSDADLQAFLQQYELIVSEYHKDKTQDVERMRSRLWYRRALNDVRNHLQLHSNHFESELGDLYEKSPPDEQDACRYVMRYVLAPNTFRVFAFSISLGALALVKDYAHDIVRDKPWIKEVLVEASDREFQRWWKTILLKPKLMRQVIGIMHLMLCMTVHEFVIFVSNVSYP